MTSTLVLPEALTDALATAAELRVETAAVLLVDPSPYGEDLRLVGHRLFVSPETAYLRRETDGMTLTPEAYVPALAEAERLGAIPIFVHTHPAAAPIPSLADGAVDAVLADVFRVRSGQEIYGTLIVSVRGGALEFSGALQPDGEPAIHIDRLWSVGSRWRLIRAFDASPTTLDASLDRNIRAFGAAVQQTLGELYFGIVGGGGTGSALAEQLVRLGVRRFILLDPDRLTASNLTRVYGSTPDDVGKLKIESLAAHLTSIAPDVRCELVPAMVTLEASARALGRADVIFGCTDDNAGRLVLSRLATYLVTPVVDCGVLLSAGEGGDLRGIDGRVTVLSPGAGCLVCRGRIDLARAMQELRTPEERRRMEDEGYAPALGQVEPAVVAFTTMVASAAVAELLERLIGYGPEPRPSEVLLRWHERETSTNFIAPRPGHYCDPLSGKLGRAGALPYLEQLWPGT